MVDVGFASSPYYINFALEEAGGEYSYLFSLCHSQNGRCSPVSSCRYLESSLYEESSAITDKSVKHDFDWAFLRSGHSSTDLDSFYIEFTSLLQRVHNACPVKDLDTLKSETTVSAG